MAQAKAEDNPAEVVQVGTRSPVHAAVRAADAVVAEAAGADEQEALTG